MCFISLTHSQCTELALLSSAALASGLLGLGEWRWEKEKPAPDSAAALPSWARPDQAQLARHSVAPAVFAVHMPRTLEKCMAPAGPGRAGGGVSWASAVAFSQELQRSLSHFELPHPSSLTQGPRCRCVWRGSLCLPGSERAQAWPGRMCWVHPLGRSQQLSDHLGRLLWDQSVCWSPQTPWDCGPPSVLSSESESQTPGRRQEAGLQLMCLSIK